MRGNMKTLKIMKLTVIALLVLLPVTAALSNDDHDVTIKQVFEEIRIDQNVKTYKQIDADKVNDNLLEKLGEAVMNNRFPDTEEHEYLDRMMGGEGSENLKEMHIRMGYHYIQNGFNNRRMMRGGWGNMTGY
jgi:hypothetical protein